MSTCHHRHCVQRRPRMQRISFPFDCNHRRAVIGDEVESSWNVRGHRTSPHSQAKLTLVALQRCEQAFSSLRDRTAVVSDPVLH